MKTKFLLLLLLCSTAITLASAKFDGFTSLKSYLKEIESIITPNITNAPVKPLGTVTMCGVTSVNFRTTNAIPMLWSNAATWTSFGATKPVAGSAVTIPAGVHIILNENTPNLANLSISGKLEFADQNLSLTAGWIMVMGTLEVGKSSTPYTKKAVITLNGTNTNEVVMGMTSTRGIMVMGGQLELHGVPPTKNFTKLNDHAAVGATSLSLVDAVSWSINDQIVIAPTDFYGAGGASQRSQITSVSGSSINIQDGLNGQRWGKLQYLTTTGMSLTPGTLPANLASGTPTVLDERGEVANLTRNIVIQSVDDAAWQNNGLGCHVMIMRYNGMVGQAHLNGVEIKRGGQAGKLARYPFHWHMLSYEGSTTLPDVTGQYIRNSVINQSNNRGIVIHGTNGAEVSNNVVYDIKGHGIFTEDASERRNTIDGNLVFKVRNPTNANALKLHETENDRGSSGFWLSNPDNTITNNRAIDCVGIGFWLAYPENTFGQSSQIILKPRYMKFGAFTNNHAHSNKTNGIHIDDVELDEVGSTGPTKYYPSSDMKGPTWPYTNSLTFELVDYTVWKNNTGGIWNRSGSPRNRRVTNADNTSKFFSGAGDTELWGIIEKSLVVGVSLNTNMNGVIRPDQYGSYEPVAFASYHSTFDMKNNVVVNFPAVAGKASGFFALDDYYLLPVDKGSVRNTDNILINSHPGVRTPPTLTQHVFGVVWDNHNYWGGPTSQDNYYVFDNPFLTYGQSKHLPQNNPASGGVIVNGPFYGFANYLINGIERTWDKIHTVRTDISGNTVGTWTVEAGQSGDILGVMRHFATHPTGYYYLDFPTIDNINDFNVLVSNMLTTNDYQVLSVEYSGDYQITNLFTSTAYDMGEYGTTKPYPTGTQYVHTYTPVADFQAVVNAPTGEVYWQDKANNKVWFKARGGVKANDPSLSATHDNNLYNTFRVRAYGVYDATPLTINFSSFEASKQTESKVRLVWAFDTDQENVNFEIQRKLAEGTFTTVGKLENKKTVKGQNQFSFVDENPIIGDNYYRIKAIDVDGDVSYTAVKSIKITTLSRSVFSIFPNPVTSVLNIKFNCMNAGSVNVLVYNTIGATVKTEQVIVIAGENSLTINLSELPTGVYTIQMFIDGEVQTKKFVKQ